MNAPYEPQTFLALLEETDRDGLLELGRSRRFDPGEHLMRQEEPGDPVLFLLAGHVKATFVEPQGKEIVLGFHGPGDVLGELSFVRAEPRSSNVVAIEPVRPWHSPPPTSAPSSDRGRARRCPSSTRSAGAFATRTAPRSSSGPPTASGGSRRAWPSSANATAR